MATYPPPSFQSTIFDTNAFNHTLANGGLTQAEADTLYLKYPLAQAFETLNQIDVAGLATFETQAIFEGAMTISNSNQNTYLGNGYAPILSGSGTQNVGIGVGVFNSSSVNLSSNTVVGYFAGNAMSNSSSNVLLGNSSGRNLTSGNQNTAIGFISGGNMNTGSGNILIGYSAGYNNGGNVDYSNCIVIANGASPSDSNQVIIGTTTQTSMNLVCSNNPTMSGYTQPASSDTTQKIATTAWVQSAIVGIGAGKVSSNKYYGSQTITVPSGVYKCDIMVFGQGGRAGQTNQYGSYAVCGGSGGGGQVAMTCGLPVLAGNTFTLTTSTISSTGQTSFSLNFGGGTIALCSVYNGNDGSAGLSSGSGAAGAGQTSAITTSSTYGLWKTGNGSVGINGSSQSYGGTSNVPAGIITGVGYSIGTTYNVANISLGSGQLYSDFADGGDIYSGSAIVLGGCQITWYVS
jgi:hypothetical protein